VVGCVDQQSMGQQLATKKKDVAKTSIKCKVEGSH
jgi:hypothetical protein